MHCQVKKKDLPRYIICGFAHRMIQGDLFLGYCIEYGMGKKTVKRRKCVTGNGKNRNILFAAMVCILLFVLLLSPFNKAVLIPGDDQITTAAAENFFTDMQDGETFENALLTFCRSIINEEIS